MPDTLLGVSESTSVAIHDVQKTFYSSAKIVLSGSKVGGSVQKIYDAHFVRPNKYREREHYTPGVFPVGLVTVQMLGNDSEATENRSRSCGVQSKRLQVGGTNS